MEKSAEKSTKNPITWMINYVQESKEELNKVTWPSKKTVFNYSVIVIIVSLLTAGFFAGLDWLLQQGLAELIRLSS
jgi:preprotein translocase subunit SecE